MDLVQAVYGHTPCATDVIEEGWWTVKIQWFEYMPKLGESPRHYKLKLNERLLAVNALVRIGQTRFENSRAGGQRESRSGVKVLGYETGGKSISGCTSPSAL